MSERESDIEFDFFDEPETREASAAERPRRRGPRRPVGPPAGLTPLLRLIGLISFAILIVVLLVFWINGCREDKRKSSYKRYIEKVSVLARESESLGRDLNTLLTSRGKKQDELERELNGLAETQEQQAARAREIDPPGPLRPEHRHVVEALELRASGLRGMADAFQRTAGTRDSKAAGKLLADQAKRLVASDVVWEDLFRAPAVAELKNQDISGVAVPASTFFPNPDLATTSSMASIWSRIHGASTGGGACSPRGTGLESVTALPARQELSRTQLNTINATKDLGFAVTVKDTGCSQEVRVRVTLTIQKSPTPIVKRATIPLINPNETQTVVFRNIGTVPFVERTSLTVEVEPVPTEKTTSNNSAQYPVIFSLG